MLYGNETEGTLFQSEKHMCVESDTQCGCADTAVRASETESRGKAVVVDGMTKDDYDKNAKAFILGQMLRMLKFQYKLLPVKRVCIAKENGKTRHMSLPPYEDKGTQGVMAKPMNNMDEFTFLDCLYGFCENRRVH